MQQVEAREIDLLCPTVGARNVCVKCGPLNSQTLQHGHYMWIHPGINMRLSIQESPTKWPVAFYLKGFAY